MVTAGKVFRLVEPTPLSDLTSKLSGYRREEEYEEGDYKFSLITEVAGLMPAKTRSQVCTPTTIKDKNNYLEYVTKEIYPLIL